MLWNCRWMVYSVTGDEMAVHIDTAAVSSPRLNCFLPGDSCWTTTYLPGRRGENRPRGQPMPGRLLARMRSQVGCSRTVTPAHYIFQIFSSSLSDCRPVTLTSVISKCFERLVLGHLKSWLSQIGMRSPIEMRYKSYLRGAHITTSPWTFKKQRKSLI